MIKAVFFDLGNVILPVDGYRLAKKLAGFSSISQDKMLDLFTKDAIINDFEKGALSPREWFRKMIFHCKLRGLGYGRFVQAFNDIFDLNTPVTQLIRQLKKGYKVGLISNTNHLHATYLIRKYKFFNDFDRMWLSHRIGIRKPDPKIFKLAVSQFAVKPDQSIFIDDLRANVRGATKIGMKGIVYRGFAPLTQDLKKMGVHI